MNAFRDAVEKLKDLTRPQLIQRLYSAMAHGDNFAVATILAEMNGRDCHGYEAPGYNLEQAAREVDEALEEAYE